MNLNPFAFLRARHARSAPTRHDRPYAAGWLDTDRLLNYQRFMLAYRGQAVRAPVGQVTPVEGRRLRHNLNRPIVNLGAAFLAAKPLKWVVDGNTQATEQAMAVWDRSGSERALLEAARCGGIMGDMVGLATVGALDGRSRIEFVCPDIAFPTFMGSDSGKLTSLDISWQEEDRSERTRTIREFYGETGREVYVDGERDAAQDQSWTALPAVWIRNLSVKGMCFGFSDLDGVTELVEEYDHVASKRTRILDYYAEPTIVFEGMQKTDLEKTTGTTFFIPTGGKVYFLEWAGNQPDVESQLNRIRNDISEITQVPAVAFGRQDSGFSSISGVALRLLYGPLLAKTNDKWANWGPPLEYLMWLCLRQEGSDVPLETVNVAWTDPLPVDGLAQASEEKAAGEAGGRSLLTIAARLGAEDPAREVRRVEYDRRFDHLAQLVQAGMALGPALVAAGFPRVLADELGAVPQAGPAAFGPATPPPRGHPPETPPAMSPAETPSGGQ